LVTVIYQFATRIFSYS